MAVWGVGSICRWFCMHVDLQSPFLPPQVKARAWQTVKQQPLGMPLHQRRRELQANSQPCQQSRISKRHLVGMQVLMQLE
jgi:hypothetical protein